MTRALEGRTGFELREAEPTELEAVAGFLEEAGLPTAGVGEEVARFVVAEERGRLLGVAGLEVHGRDGVLRSVAVRPDVQGRGLGAQLTERMLAAARAEGLRRVYLLTTTADGYFPRHGFRPVERTEASPEVRDSVEFRSACPASAAAMVLDLDQG